MDPNNSNKQIMPLRTEFLEETGKNGAGIPLRL